MTMPDAGASERVCETQANTTCRHCGGYGPTVVRWEDGAWAHKTINGCAAWFRDETQRLYLERASLMDERSALLAEVARLREALHEAAQEAKGRALDLLEATGIIADLSAQIAEAEARGRSEMREEAAEIVDGHVRLLAIVAEGPGFKGVLGRGEIEGLEALASDIRALPDRREP